MNQPDEQNKGDSESRCREQLEELNQIFADSPVGLGVIDRNMRVLRVNERLAEITGIPPEQQIGRTMAEVVPDMAEQLEKIFRSILETGEPLLGLDISGMTSKAPGELRHWLASYFPLRSSTREIVGVLIAVAEITERRRMEIDLRLTQFAVEHAPDAVYWIDDTSHFVYVNDTACSMLGYTHDELLSMGVGDIDPIFPMDQWYEIWERNRAIGTVILETQHKTKQGKIIPVELSVNFIEYEGRTLNCAYVRDITERKRAEEAVRESSEMLKLVLDTIPVPVWWKDRNGVYLGTNRLNAMHAGLSSPEEMLGKTDLEMPWKDTEAERYRADDLEVVESGIPKLNYEETQHTATGELIWLRTNKVPLRNADGEIVGALGTFENITERKLAEQALRKANRTLAALSRVNEILVRATEESDLLQEVCQATVDTGGYLMCWIALAENDEQKTVRPAAYAGHEAGFLNKIEISWGDSRKDQGPTGQAIRTGKLQLISDVSSDPAFEPWRAEALKRGYACSVSLPLTVSGKPIGAITLYRAEPGCLEWEEEKLLTQLASDLSYGIASLRTKKQHEEAEAQRRVFEQRLEEHKRKFYRETILSVTDGKLDVCDASDVAPYVSNAEVKIEVEQPTDVSLVRSEVQAFLKSSGLDGEDLSMFIVGIGEAINNALKHGRRGTVYMGHRGDEVWVAVKDEGTGIESIILPRAVLQRGFSTKPSLGLGYSLMLAVSDRILLSTGTHGTTVVLVKSLGHEEKEPLDTIPDTWAGVPDLVK